MEVARQFLGVAGFRSRAGNNGLARDLRLARDVEARLHRLPDLVLVPRRGAPVHVSQEVLHQLPLVRELDLAEARARRLAELLRPHLRRRELKFLQLRIIILLLSLLLLRVLLRGLPQRVLLLRVL